MKICIDLLGLLVLFTGASAAFLFGRVMLDWTIHGESLLGLLTLAGGILVTLSAFTSSMIFCYVVYVLFGTLYHIQMTVA
jgi:Reduced folate carrier.